MDNQITPIKNTTLNLIETTAISTVNKSSQIVIFREIKTPIKFTKNPRTDPFPMRSRGPRNSTTNWRAILKKTVCL